VEALGLGRRLGVRRDGVEELVGDVAPVDAGRLLVVAAVVAIAARQRRETAM
jgi:hypothetical protein